jgi:hypothetical protein
MPHLMDASQLDAFYQFDAEVDFACPVCEGTGHTFDSDGLSARDYGCENCGGFGILPSGELPNREYMNRALRGELQ